jgi:RNA polymerase sigma factor (sigma-70 family)
MPTHPVLLVDDELTIVAGLQQILSVENIPATIATDAVSAEKMASDHFYPVVLADLRLQSGDDGLRLIETIRRISPGSAVAAMTGHATPDIERHLREIGASTLLRKPFDTDAFLSTIRTLRPKNLETLYRETAPRLRAMMARRFGLSPDQTQDVLHQAWCALLQNRRFVLDAGAWLTGTAINLCKQALERSARERPFEAFPAAERSYTAGTVAVTAVRQALQRLDEKSRVLCELIGLEQLSYAEVSDRLAIPLGSVGPLYIRAKEKLRHALEN